MRRQRGVALITALLVVAIATILAVQLTGRQHFDIRRTQNVLEHDRARSFALAAEDWARQILTENRAEGSRAVDHLNEFWAQEIMPPPFEGVRLLIRIEDLQGRLNINNLTSAGGSDVPAQIARFRRLLQLHQQNPGIIPAVLDWIDPGVEVRIPDGAGDDYYTRLDPPYRSANRPMQSVTELRLVRGVDDELYRLLAPSLTALPEAVPINVNTASASVLRTVADELGEAEAKALLEARPDDGHETVEDFLRHNALAGRDIDEASLSVTSNWFRVRVEVRLGNTRLRSESLVHRGERGRTRTLARRHGFLE